MMNKKETTLKEIWDKLSENQEILTEIARWLRFQNIGRLKEVLIAELDTDEKKLAFENTDGERGIKEVAEMAKISQDTVYSWWRKWSNLGILEPSETRKGRLRKFCSLEDVGIRVPTIAQTSKKNEPSKEVTTETPSEAVKSE